MPANLTPQYQKAEERYRRAQSAEERVACLEEMLQLIPKHKGTEKLQADLKTRLKETKSEAQSEKQAPKGGKSFRFPRQGAGTVILLGGPNSGKSRILAELTNAEPNVADFPFSTHEPLPGMMNWEDVKVQLIDTPPVAPGHLEPYLLGFVRSSDLVLLCFDGSSDDAAEETASLVEEFSNRKTHFAAQTAFDEEDLGRLSVRTRLVVTRGADPDVETRLDLFREVCALEVPVLRVELTDPESCQSLRGDIFEALELIRIYTKRPGQPAERVDPFTIPRGGTVEDLAERVHRDLAKNLKHARVWGASAHDGQTVGRDHILAEGDVVELHA